MSATTTRHAASRCPACGHKLDASTALSDPETQPKEGDATICIACGELLTYRRNLTVRRMLRAEYEELPEAILLRHGILMETTRTEEDLVAAREYIAMLGRETESATEFPARLNENCVWCDHSAQCPTYHRALLGKVESVCQDEKDLEAVAREREEVARMAKVLYARKDALEKILKVQLQEVDRLELGGMVYTIGKTTQVSYPTAPTLTVFRELTGKDEDELVPLLLSVEKAKVDTLVKDLSKSLAPADARMLKARIEAIADKSVSPRFNAQRATTTAAAGETP